MPAKKSSNRAASAGSNSVWMWIYVIGLIVAGLAGAFSNVVPGLQPWLTYLLILAGILSGLFFLDSGEVVNFAIRFLLLGAVAKALDAVPLVGTYFSGFFGGVFSYLAPVGLTLLVVYFWKKYFGSMM